MLSNRVVSYAQNREDIILSGFFDEDETGFYVDVGANEPVHESVTKYFYDRGWSGINIEPIPVLYKKLKAERTRDINLQLGVGLKEHQAELHYYPQGDGLSTMSEKMAQEYEKKPNEVTKKVEVLKVDVEPLKKILDKHAKDKKISFLKVDVEGYEYEVLASNDWTKFKPEVICIEANHVHKDWRPLLKKNEYKLVFFDGLNEYYVDKNSIRAKKFNYVRAVIYKEPIVNFRTLKDFASYEKTIDWLDDEKKKVAEESQEKSKRIAALEKELEEIKTFSKHLKKSVKIRARGLDSKILGRLDKKANYKASDISVTSQNLLDAAKMYDAENLKQYVKTHKHSIRLRAYSKSKKTAIKLARKAVK